MNSHELERIVITGASSGIGRDLARQLAGPGKELWLIGRDASRLAAVAAEVIAAGAVAKSVILDLEDSAAVEVFLQGELQAAGPVDSLYCAAGVSIFGEVKDLLQEDWARVYRIDLLSAIQMTCEIYQTMVARGKGRIVLVASLAAYAGYPTSVPYATMKAGLLGLYRTLSYEGKIHGVKVHICSPGYVETGIFKSAIYRGTDYAKTMALISSLGFSLIPAAEAATTLLKRVVQGSGEFAFPCYARVMAWSVQRFAFVAKPLHASLLKRFRNSR